MTGFTLLFYPPSVPSLPTVFASSSSLFQHPYFLSPTYFPKTKHVSQPFPPSLPPSLPRRLPHQEPVHRLDGVVGQQWSLVQPHLGECFHQKFAPGFASGGGGGGVREGREGGGVYGRDDRGGGMRDGTEERGREGRAGVVCLYGRSSFTIVSRGGCCERREGGREGGRGGSEGCVCV